MAFYVRRPLSVVCFSAMLATGALPQTPGVSGVNVVVQRISVEQGLSHPSVSAIMQDMRGFIWIGTVSGLNRFDGQNFVVFSNRPNDTTSLSNDFIRSLLEDRKGYIWVGTNRGLNRFDPATGTFRRYFCDPADKSSLSSDGIRSIYQDRSGVIWVGTVSGMNRFERSTDTWKRFPLAPEDSTRPGDNIVGAILEDRQGSLWVGTGWSLCRGGGLFRFDRINEMFSRYRHSPSDRVNLADDWITSLFEDGSGTLWVLADRAGVNKLDGLSGAFTHFSLPGESAMHRPTGGLNSICEDRKGSMWIAGWPGLYKYDRGTGTFTGFSSSGEKPGSISSRVVTALFVDRSGMLWVGTEWAGVNTVVTRPFLYRKTLGHSLRVDTRIGALLADRQGNLWIGGEGEFGLWRFDPGTQKSTHLLPKGHASIIYQDAEGTIWIVLLVDVLKYDPVNHTSRLVWKVPSRHGSREWISCVLRDGDGCFWAGTPGGTLYRIGKTMREYSVFVHDPGDPRSMTAGMVNSIREDRSGNVWVGTEVGLNRFDRRTQSFTRFIHDEKDTSSLSDNHWCSIVEDRSGTLWIGTADGLNRFNRTTSTFTRFYPAEPRSRFVNQMLEDERGCLWYGTPQNVSIFDPSTGNFRTFNEADGLNSGVLGWSYTRLKSGELLFGTPSGILVFHPDSVRHSTDVPPVVITGIKKFNQPIRLSTSPELLREIAIEHDENVFSLEFAALSYDMPGFNQYAYMLEGFDRDWVYCGNRREASYTNLDPGKYTFRVKGCGHEGVWNESGTSLSVIINPAFWQTWWFRLLAGGGLAVVFAFVYRREVTRLREERSLRQELSRRQIESQEEERKRLAAELHDGLGQDLLVMNNEIQQLLQEGLNSSRELNQVASLLQESIEGVREIASNLHPHQLERLGFSAAVETMVEKLSHSSGLIICRTGDNIDRALPREAEIHLYRIIQEALSNVVRHASAKSANVRMRRGPASIEIVVTDDGKGFTVGKARDHHPPLLPGECDRGLGLATMAERARIIGGKLNIESSQRSGTTVSVTLPCS